MTDNTLPRAEWDALSADEQFQYMQLCEKSDNQFREFLRLIPECPDHGDQCIPHAKEWVTIKNEITPFTMPHVALKRELEQRIATAQARSYRGYLRGYEIILKNLVYQQQDAQTVDWLDQWAGAAIMWGIMYDKATP